MMFTPVAHHIWRWLTPDPEDHWMMVGHLIQGNQGVVLIDPPMRPDLPATLQALGGVLAIILTTHDHTRGARYLGQTFRAPIYVPAQASRTNLIRAGINNPVFYDETTPLPLDLRAVRCTVALPLWQSETDPYVDEMMLVLPGGMVATGDLVMGSENGTLLACPEGFNDPADKDKVKASLAVFASRLPKDSTTLLASHGSDIIRDLPELIYTRQRDFGLS
ncbi:MAG: MBL fold metallo-hydrolase [Firmicutes bacterium]|nr:MBL fold metallo-hydrolase [Bacillota bacterium]